MDAMTTTAKQLQTTGLKEEMTEFLLKLYLLSVPFNLNQMFLLLWVGNNDIRKKASRAHRTALGRAHCLKEIEEKSILWTMKPKISVCQTNTRWATLRSVTLMPISHITTRSMITVPVCCLYVAIFGGKTCQIGQSLHAAERYLPRNCRSLWPIKGLYVFNISAFFTLPELPPTE